MTINPPTQFSSFADPFVSNQQNFNGNIDQDQEMAETKTFEAQNCDLNKNYQKDVKMKSTQQKKFKSSANKLLPTRVQARRVGKIGEAGAFCEEKLKERLIVPQSIKPQEIKQKPAEVHIQTIDQKDPYALIRIEN